MEERTKLLKELEEKWEIMRPLLDEQSKRIWAGMEAKRVGWGGLIILEKATGVTRKTISKGVKQIKKVNMKPELKFLMQNLKK